MANSLSRYHRLLTTLSILSYLIVLTNSTTYYVDPSAGGTSTGRSWSNAFTTLDSALSAATNSGDQIWLKGGYTYIPSNPSDQTDCFVTTNGISIYGGFTGSESSTNERSTSTAKSILSGDIGVSGDHSDNCYHVITYNQVLRLDTITIQHGNASYNIYDYSSQDNVLHRYGGAIITSSSVKATDLTLQNVIIRNNTALNGGGLWIAGSPNKNMDIKIIDSLFEYNSAVDGIYEGGYGGCIYSTTSANVSIFNTQFNSNKASFRGAAIYEDYGAKIYAQDCTFSNNEVNGWGGAIFSEDRNSQSDGTFPVVIGSTFTDNYAGVDGGAIFWYNKVFGTMTDNTFRRNTAGNKGGAIAVVDGSTANISGHVYHNNVAMGNASTNNEYLEPESKETFTTTDDSLTFDITAELTELYSQYTAMSTSETDLYPFNAADALCYVDISNTNSVQTGASWDAAYNDLQDCLDDLASTGGEVWVATGTYIPTSIPDWKLRIGKSQSNQKSFIMYDDIRMYGGFDGTETSRDGRNWRDNPTYLSGQVTHRTQVNQILNSADNTLIDGFIFENAGVSGSGRRRLKNSISVAEVLSSTATNPGAGVYSNSTTVSIVNCIFHKLLSGGKGGGIYCIGLQGETGITKVPKIVNTAFLGNRAAARGGAISADVECAFECIKCKFDSNASSKKGGAIYLDFDCDPTWVDVTFQNNYALESGGCIAADGGSMNTFYGSATFTDNYARMEGGCLYSGSGVGKNVDQGFSFEDAPVFTGNHMVNEGIGQSDHYGWPFSKFVFGSTRAPTTTSEIVFGSTRAPTTTSEIVTLAPSSFIGGGPTLLTPTAEADRDSGGVTCTPSNQAVLAVMVVLAMMNL